MDVPILDNGERLGTLRISRDGLYTRFEAAIPARAGLHRLWLCGEQGAACLGLLTPEGETLVLRRRLSRAECRRLPAPLRCAALAEPKRETPEERPKQPGPHRIKLFGEDFVTYG